MNGEQRMKSLPLEGKVSPPIEAVTDEVEAFPFNQYTA